MKQTLINLTGNILLPSTILTMALLLIFASNGNYVIHPLF